MSETTKDYSGQTPLNANPSATEVRLRFDVLMDGLDQHYEHGAWDEQVVAWYIAQEVRDAAALPRDGAEREGEELRLALARAFTAANTSRMGEARMVALCKALGIDIGSTHGEMADALLARARPAETENAGLTHSGPCAACGQTIPATPAETAPVADDDALAFAAWLTTRDAVIEVGASKEAGPIAEAVHEWRKMHPLSPPCTNPHNDTSDPNHHCWHARETCCHCEADRPSPSAEPTEEQVEAAAIIVYAAMQSVSREGQTKPWVEGGNSLAQGEARRAARAALRASGGR